MPHGRPSSHSHLHHPGANLRVPEAPRASRNHLLRDGESMTLLSVVAHAAASAGTKIGDTGPHVRSVSLRHVRVCIMLVSASNNSGPSHRHSLAHWPRPNHLLASVLCDVPTPHALCSPQTPLESQHLSPVQQATPHAMSCYGPRVWPGAHGAGPLTHACPTQQCHRATVSERSSWPNSC